MQFNNPRKSSAGLNLRLPLSVVLGKDLSFKSHINKVMKAQFFLP